MNNATPKTVWHIGGEDVRLRIPLLLALRERGFHVGAVGSEDGVDFAVHDIPYFRYTLKREINPVADLYTRSQLFHLFTKYQPDIVHGFDTKPAIIAPVIAKKAKVPGIVRTITGMGYIFSSNSPLALALRPIYCHLQGKASAAGITVFQNPDDRQYFHEHGMVQNGCDDLVLGSGIDVEKFINDCPKPEVLANLRQELGLEGQLVVTMIARLVVAKGVREYLDAASMVRRLVKNVKFLLIGSLSSEGRQAVSIQEIQQKADDICYLGSRNDIGALLSLSDIFVLPSYYREGVPRVLLEAGAMKLPLITTNMPGCKEVVRDGWNGLLIPARNGKILATAIMQLLKSKEQRILMGNRSSLHIKENFCLKKVADSYTNIYYRALGAMHL
ncbi:glycosyltransferase family 4 protein [Chlorogloeopsis sp. ULAP01]|uniref:glycosyltransferase family 4 protein n=1 Tax=Chlorogloeopsis sp. ULAP01 TaxID=3056483 RepID=UPI0025AA4AB2|nr:glycosyltransferase family 4 protein [Chlorogloeopsis sp. ULAP01]MDM9381281.1 glycosyltransferase family 4 protein [Chlorogloeopsis sp. ULAP01]